MAVWLVRAGRYGQREALALQEGLAVIGWEELPDLSGIASREQLEALCLKVYKDAKANTITNWVGQLWAFLRGITPGDLIVLPLKSRSAIAVGRVVGPYRFRTDLPEDVKHTRPVEWIRKDIPRSAVDQDLRYSLGAFMTVCRIQRNNAEERIKAILEGKAAPRPVTSMPADDEGAEELAALQDVERTAKDQIQDHIAKKFAGHGLARLVDAVLRAQGYQTEVSPPGADGGVDIIAGRGPLGFDPPRLCVQVKSGNDSSDVKTIRELQGVLKRFGAEQGLFVSWGGFKQSVPKEARQLFFEIRLWDADDLLEALLQHYDQLPADLQAELPLKRIWTLVLED